MVTGIVAINLMKYNIQHHFAGFSECVFHRGDNSDNKRGMLLYHDISLCHTGSHCNQRLLQ